MLSAAHLHTIEQALTTRSGRVVVVELDRQRVIVKRQESRARPFGYSALNLAAKILQQPILCAVPAYGGAKGQATEVRRLRQLKDAAVAVPEVLHTGSDWIAISDAGETSIDYLLTRSTEPQLATWDKALAAILDTHRKGQTLSQAFARNIHLHDGEIIFIDFEDDPLEVLSLAQAQTRDWLLFIHSTVYLMQLELQVLTERFAHFVGQDSTEVQALIKNSGHSLAWLRHLPKQRKPWGRDVISLQGAGALMHAFAQLRPRLTSGK
ncbi:hypothetical protein NT239_11890 [Chitinibacter sp. SCUT-21]|uniref:hypothetical protein n=1 Tax=Chitinibacter sp. SCUT-21 TaxID=2970891 RepID=UPI0035A58DCA